MGMGGVLKQGINTLQQFSDSRQIRVSFSCSKYLVNLTLGVKKKGMGMGGDLIHGGINTLPTVKVKTLYISNHNHIKHLFF